VSILASAIGGEEKRKRTDVHLRAMTAGYRQIIQTAKKASG